MKGILREREEFKIQAGRYLKDQWPAALLTKRRDFSLQEIHKGVESLVLSLHIDNSPPSLVVKGFRSPGMFNKITRAYHCLAAAGINVPKIIYTDNSRRTFKRYGYYLMFEEKIQGKTLSQLEDLPRFIPIIAENFSRMHRVRSRKWGFVGRRIRWGFHLYILKEVRKWLKKLKQYSEISESEFKACWKWFKLQRKIVKKYNTYSLIHGDPLADNIFFTSDDQMFLVDLGRVKYFPFLVDVSILKRNFSKDMASSFEKYYCDLLPEKQLEEFHNCKDFYESLLLVKWITIDSADARRFNESKPRKEYWKKLLLDKIDR